ncbi:hypothetical protein ABPG72_010872 [Tetrahymena utriculariae]
MKDVRHLAQQQRIKENRINLTSLGLKQNKQMQIEKEKNQKIRRKKNQIKKLPKFKIEEEFFIHLLINSLPTTYTHLYMHLPPTIQEHQQKQQNSKQKERKNNISMCEMLIEHNFRPHH